MKTYLVGGAVRDTLLKLPVTERDFVVIGETPATMEAAGFQAVGRDFPVFLHPQTHEEYALARTERKNGHGYRGFVVNSDPNITLEEDLLRRDLTINAIAQSDDGTLIDPYHGQADLNHKILRHVSPAFIEDPLRVLRVARFAARFHHLGFIIAPETQALMRSIVEQGEITYLVSERVWAETEKALATQNPYVYFEVLQQCGALNIIFPALAKLFEAGHASDMAQAKHALERAVLNTTDIAIRFATWLIPITNEDFQLFATQYRLPAHIKTLCLLAQRYNYPFLHITDMEAHALLTFLQELDAIRRTERFMSLLNIFAIYYNLNQNHKTIQYALKALQAIQSIPIAELINGKSQQDIPALLENARINALKNFKAQR
jgi:tRNA nucleotidyltransferase (CCA-adding enzyme)